MLNPAAANPLARGAVRRRSLLKPGVALRFMLMVTALTYVLGPTVAQWVSFDTVRAEVAAVREATSPVGADVADAVSPEVQAVLESIAPDDVRGLVGPGLSALGTIHEGASDVRASMMAAAVRATQVTLIMLAVVVVGFRSTLRYRPRHGSGWMSMLLGRNG